MLKDELKDLSNEYPTASPPRPEKPRDPNSPTRLQEFNKRYPKI